MSLIISIILRALISVTFWLHCLLLMTVFFRHFCWVCMFDNFQRSMLD